MSDKCKNGILNDVQTGLAIDNTETRQAVTREYLQKQGIGSSGHEVIDALYVMEQEKRLSLKGNLIPDSWLDKIVASDGKPYFLAIHILAEIVFRHRSQPAYDEISKKQVLQKFFKHRMYHLNRQEMAAKYRMQPKAVTQALNYLEKNPALLARLEGHALIKRSYDRNIGEDYFSQRVFIHLNLSGLQMLSSVDKESDVPIRGRLNALSMVPLNAPVGAFKRPGGAVQTPCLGAFKRPSTVNPQRIPKTTTSGFAAEVVGVVDTSEAGAAAPCTPATPVPETEPGKLGIRELFLSAGLSDLNRNQIDDYFSKKVTDAFTVDEENIRKAEALFRYISGYYKKLYKSSAPWTKKGKSRLLAFVEYNPGFDEFTLLRIVAEAWHQFLNVLDRDMEDRQKRFYYCYQLGDVNDIFKEHPTKGICMILGAARELNLNPGRMKPSEDENYLIKQGVIKKYSDGCYASCVVL